MRLWLNRGMPQGSMLRPDYMQAEAGITMRRGTLLRELQGMYVVIHHRNFPSNENSNEIESAPCTYVENAVEICIYKVKS